MQRLDRLTRHLERVAETDVPIVERRQRHQIGIRDRRQFDDEVLGRCTTGGSEIDGVDGTCDGGRASPPSRSMTISRWSSSA